MFVFKGHLTEIFLNNKPTNFCEYRKNIATPIIIAVLSVDNITYYLSYSLRNQNELIST